LDTNKYTWKITTSVLILESLIPFTVDYSPNCYDLTLGKLEAFSVIALSEITGQLDCG
jgi:hypothetical protein